MARRLWANVDGEPFLINPALAVWGGGNAPKPKPRRRRRGRPSGITKGGRAMPRRRRRTRGARRRTRRRSYSHNMPRRRYARTRGRRNQVPALMNYRRRRYRRNPDGLADVQALMPAIGTGIMAGLAVGWATPFAVRWFNLPPAGMMYRLAQAGVAWGLGWFAQSMRLLRPGTAKVFIATGMTFAGLGLLQDFQAGLLMPAAAAPTPTAEILRETAMLTGMGNYETGGGRYMPYGASRMGYYQAI